MAFPVDRLRGRRRGLAAREPLEQPFQPRHAFAKVGHVSVESAEVAMESGNVAAHRMLTGGE